MLFFVLYLLFVFWLVWPLRWSYHLWHVRFPIYLHLSMLDSVIVHLWSCKDILRIKQVVWNGAVFLMRSSYLVGKLASLQQCRKLVEFFLGWLYVYIYMIWLEMLCANLVGFIHRYHAIRCDGVVSLWKGIFSSPLAHVPVSGSNVCYSLFIASTDMRHAVLHVSSRHSQERICVTELVDSPFILATAWKGAKELVRDINQIPSK